MFLIVGNEIKESRDRGIGVVGNTNKDVDCPSFSQEEDLRACGMRLWSDQKEKGILRRRGQEEEIPREFHRVQRGGERPLCLRMTEERGVYRCRRTVH